MGELLVSGRVIMEAFWVKRRFCWCSFCHATVIFLGFVGVWWLGYWPSFFAGQIILKLKMWGGDLVNSTQWFFRGIRIFLYYSLILGPKRLQNPPKSLGNHGFLGNSASPNLPVRWCEGSDAPPDCFNNKIQHFWVNCLLKTLPNWWVISAWFRESYFSWLAGFPPVFATWQTWGMNWPPKDFLLYTNQVVELAESWSWWHNLGKKGWVRSRVSEGGLKSGFWRRILVSCPRPKEVA